MRVSRTVGVCLALYFLYAGMTEASEPRTVPLTLQQCRELVLMQNLQIEVSRLGYETAQRLFRAERGALFEPELVLGAQRESNERQNTSEQFIAQGVPDFAERNRLYSAGLEQPLPTGGRLALSYSLQDLENNLVEQRDLEGFEREYVGFMGVSLTQPLLRNGGFSTALAAMRLARQESEAAFQDWRRALMQSVAGAEASYWDLVIAQQRADYRSASVEVAEKVLEDNRLRVETGRMSDIEVQRAEAGLALRQAQQREADQALFEAAANLKSLFAELMETESITIRAVDEPAMQPPADNQPGAMQEALALHPDYLTRQSLVEQDRLRVDFARNQRWPQIDLQADYGFNGYGEDSSTAMDRVSDQDYPAWSVRVQARIPLGGSVRGRNELAAARAKLNQSELALENTMIELGNRLVAGRQRVRNAYLQAQGYRQAMEMNEALLETELARLEAGQSDSREVLEIEERLTSARESYAESVTRYQVALLELELANGTLLVKRDADPMQAEMMVRRTAGGTPAGEALDPNQPIPRRAAEPAPLPVRDPRAVPATTTPRRAAPSAAATQAGAGLVVPRRLPPPSEPAAAPTGEIVSEPPSRQVVDQPVPRTPIERPLPRNADQSVPRTPVDALQPVPRGTSTSVQPAAPERPAAGRVLDPTMPMSR
jgi:outer membrane protein